MYRFGMRIFLEKGTLLHLLLTRPGSCLDPMCDDSKLDSTLDTFSHVMFLFRSYFVNIKG